MQVSAHKASLFQRYAEGGDDPKQGWGEQTLACSAASPWHCAGTRQKPKVKSKSAYLDAGIRGSPRGQPGLVNAAPACCVNNGPFTAVRAMRGRVHWMEP
jgi:hypothetical protein